jgi:23S rRNA (adenine2503-C2)-methyltransferase
MGMGEPLDNLEGVFGAIEILQNNKGINFSRKRITVSTSGLVDRIPLITKSGARLAVSLNGSNDEVRSEIMPINKKHPIKELLAATDKHSEESGEETTFEYVLLKGVTDEMKHARELALLLKGRKAMVNLIPFNEHPESGYVKPDPKRVDEFQAYLLKKGIRVYKRQTRGEDIYAACGQLHAVNKEEQL